jgi:SAM-dependent methyltransferase
VSQDITTGYDDFAEIYNRWMGEDFLRRALPAIDALLLNSLPPGARVLDLCCGTGQIARALAPRGFRVTGVDSSPQMLRFARQNCPEAEFLLADARNFSPPHPFDAALSTFNSLAHLDTLGDLQRVFRMVRTTLAPGSAFLFDLSIEAAYASKWTGSFTHFEGDRACVVRPTYDASSRTGINRITVFKRRCRSQPPNRHERTPDVQDFEKAFLDHWEGFAIVNDWERRDFEILQRCHPQAEVHNALRVAGFSSIHSYDAQQHLAIPGEWGRTFFLCR